MTSTTKILTGRSFNCADESAVGGSCLVSGAKNPEADYYLVTIGEPPTLTRSSVTSEVGFRYMTFAEGKGGGIAAYATNILVIEFCMFRDNAAVDVWFVSEREGYGAALSLLRGTKATIRNTRFERNSAEKRGGAVYVRCEQYRARQDGALTPSARSQKQVRGRGLHGHL